MKSRRLEWAALAALVVFLAWVFWRLVGWFGGG